MKEMKVLESNWPRIEVTQEFIDTNRLKLQSVDDILKKAIESQKQDSIFNFRIETYAKYLPLDKYILLVPEERKIPHLLRLVDAGEKWTFVDTIEEAAQDFMDYMQFAWMKALDERGLSAERSIQKLEAFLWVMSREDLATLIESAPYNPYGAPALIEVCHQMNIDVPDELIEFAKHKR